MSDPQLIVAGLPLGLHQRIKNTGLALDGWRLRLLPGRHPSRSQIDRLLADRVSTELSCDEQGGHAFGFSSDPDRDDAVQSLARHFRFRWLNTRMLEHLPTQLPDFVGELQQQADFEQAWRGSLRPVDPASPLLIPVCAFAPKQHGRIWEQVASVGPSSGVDRSTHTIEAIVREVGLFRRVHRTPDGWLDRKELIFKVDEVAHGGHEPEVWRWKFSWRVPGGFHYDVTHGKRERFVVYDLARATHSRDAGRHVNIDCHGRCRQ